jgi:PAS domain S-box-containing protein
MRYAVRKERVKGEESSVMSSEYSGEAKAEADQNKTVDLDLLELEKYIHDIRKFLPVPVCQISPRGVILDSDKAFEELLHYPKNELIGTLLSSHFVQKEEFEYVHETTLAKGGVKNHRLALKSREGETIMVNASTLVRKDEGGRHIGYFASFVDVTEQEKSDTALRESEEKFSMVFHKSNDAIFIHDLKGRIIDVNQRVIDEFGYTRDEFLRLCIADIHPKSARAESRRAFQTVSREGMVKFEIDFMRKDGSTFPAEVSSSVFKLKGKRMVQGIVRNITERKVAMEALRESEEKCRNVIEHSLQGIVIIQSEPFQIQFANPALVKAFGYSYDDMSKHTLETISTLIHEEDRAMVLKRLRTALAGNALSPPYQLRILRKDGSIAWIEIHGTNIVYKGKPAVQISVIDITKRKNIEKELEESEEKYRNLIEQSFLGVIIAKVGPLRVYFANSAAAHIFGYSVEELTRLPPEEIQKRIHPDDMPVILERFKALMEGDVARRHEIRIRKKDGTERWIEIYGHRIEHRGMSVLQVIVSDITEKREAERARLESELRYKILFEKSPLAITVVNATGVITDCNTRTEQMTGYRKEEIVRKRFDELLTLTPGSMPSLQEKFEKLASGYDVEPYELEIIKKNGTKRIVRVTNATVTEKETIIGFQIIAADITEQKKIENEIGASEQRYLRLSQEFKGILDAIPDNLTFQGPDMRIVWANQAAAVSISRTVDDLIGKRCFELWHGRKEPCEGCPVILAMQKNLPAVGEIKTPDSRYWEVRGFPILENGKVRGAVEIARDITGRRLMEVALREGEEKYRLLLEQSGDIISYFSEEGMVLVMNKNAAQGLKSSPRELVGKHLNELFDEQLSELAFERIRRVVMSGESEEHEDIVALPTENGWFRSSYHLVRGATGKPVGVQIISRNITERKRMEEELQRSERMKLLAQLAMGVSHEVRNPLGAILASTEALCHDLEGHSEYSEYLSHIRTQVHRLSVLMKDLLELGKPMEESAFEHEALQMLCSSGIELWKQTTVFKNHTIRFEKPAGGKNIIVRADGARIQQVCINLIENAAQNSPEGSEITLRIFEPRDGIVRFQVIDEGSGINDEDLGRVFEPFFSTRRQGSGLGLSIVKQIIETHGGTVDIRNNEDRPGCTAEIVLPIIP